MSCFNIKEKEHENHLCIYCDKVVKTVDLLEAISKPEHPCYSCGCAKAYNRKGNCNFKLREGVTILTTKKRSFMDRLMPEEETGE